MTDELIDRLDKDAPTKSGLYFGIGFELEAFNRILGRSTVQNEPPPQLDIPPADIPPLEDTSQDPDSTETEPPPK